MKPGDLVKYIPSPSHTFKWERYVDNFKVAPGIVVKQVDSRGVATRRFEVRWHDGQVSEEWISYLEPFRVEER